MNIDERELERLAKELEDKGYTGLFVGLGRAEGFKSSLKNYLKNLNPNVHPKDIFPIEYIYYLIGRPGQEKCTQAILSAGELKDRERNVCKFRIQYDEQKGFEIDRIMYAKIRSGKATATPEGEIILSSMNELPTKEEMNKKIQQLAKNTNKKRFGL